MSIYQDVTDAELARERRYEKRRERAAKIERKRRVAGLRFAEEIDSIDEMAFANAIAAADAWQDIPIGYSNAV